MVLLASRTTNFSFKREAPVSRWASKSGNVRTNKCRQINRAFANDDLA